MKGLNVLIRLARHATDERSADLGRVGMRIDSSVRAIASHDDQVVHELHVAANDPLLATASGHWSRHASRQRLALVARHEDLIQQEEEARDALRSAYLGLKRLELARETRDRESRRLTTRRAERHVEETYATMREAARA